MAKWSYTMERCDLSAIASFLQKCCRASFSISRYEPLPIMLMERLSAIFVQPHMVIQLVEPSGSAWLVEVFLVSSLDVSVQCVQTHVISLHK